MWSQEENVNELLNEPKQDKIDPQVPQIENNAEALNTEEVSKSLDAQPSTSDSRLRTLTEKGQEMFFENAQNHEQAFLRAYDSWKRTARESRTTLKALCSPDDLNTIQREIQTKYDKVRCQYQPITRNQTTTPDIANKMDACGTVTEDILSITKKRLETNIENYKEYVERERVRIVLNKYEYASIFGHTITETVISETSRKSNHRSGAASNRSGSSSAKRLDAEAELAARLEQAKAMKDIQSQQTRLTRLEGELKLEEMRMLTEGRIKLEEERTKLEQLKAEKEVQVAAARVKVYESFESDSEDDGAYYESNPAYNKTEPTAQPKPTTTSLQTRPAPLESAAPKETARHKAKHTAQLNPRATPFQTQPASSGTTAHEETFSLAQALASSLSISRLPVPEPTVFSGDPIKYVDWKMSFMALIDQKPILTSEKMFYLKTYLSGDALKAVEGFFYSTSEDAYKGAWKVLQERYGNPFIVQNAFRDKLAKWPKISSTDPRALRDFADFLQGCAEAIPHVKGLSILDDCEENRKLLKKLPDWIVRKWSRIVVDELDKSESYPNLTCFTEFLNKEVRIVCNPITSSFFMNAKDSDERPKKARALNTSTQEEDSTQDTQGVSNNKVKTPCTVCKDETHGIGRCPTFASKTMEDKRAFIHEHHLCFGCLRKGHISKECKRRYTCSTCHRRHPTCLHEERKQKPAEETNNGLASTDNSTTSQGVHVHASTQYVQATASIVPVLVSSDREPQKEVLTYALLDTQSDSTFILKDILDDLNVDSQPVQLKLSTMTATDTILTSQSIHGLQVRG